MAHLALLDVTRPVSDLFVAVVILYCRLLGHFGSRVEYH